METSDFDLGFGVRGNYYLYDREDTYWNFTLFGEPYEGVGEGEDSNLWNQDRTYVHGYFRFIHDFFDLQLAIGYSEKLREYTSDCPGEWAGCEMSHSGTEGGFDMLVKMGLEWGGD